jgi:hypothetical protein
MVEFDNVASTVLNLQNCFSSPLEDGNFSHSRVTISNNIPHLWTQKRTQVVNFQGFSAVRK